MIRFLLLLHVLGAIVAVGFSLSYGLWLARGSHAGRREQAFALRTISWIDRRATTPAYVLQLITGLLLVWRLGLRITQWPWLWISLVLYALLTILAIARFAPAHRRQTALAERLADGEAVEADYASATKVASRWGAAVVVLTLAIVVLMVTKPS